jgi:predicted regulator of Ras-like GTPase activity (Roadblock/LC7/MglB family)
MAAGNFIITEQDYTRFMGVLETLDRSANAKFVFLLDKSGQQVAATGELTEVDPTSLASLTAGNVAATEGVAQLVGENEFTTLFHEGKRESLHISVVGGRLILLVVFDERSSVGLVRLRVEQCSPQLQEIVQDMFARADGGEAPVAEGASVLGEISDADLDSLFGE